MFTEWLIFLFLLTYTDIFACPKFDLACWHLSLADLLYLTPQMNSCLEKISPIYFKQFLQQDEQRCQTHTLWKTVEHSFFVRTERTSITDAAVNYSQESIDIAPCKSLHCMSASLFVSGGLYKLLQAGLTSPPKCRWPRQGVSMRSLSLFLLRPFTIILYTALPLTSCGFSRVQLFSSNKKNTKKNSTVAKPGMNT